MRGRDRLRIQSTGSREEGDWDRYHVESTTPPPGVIRGQGGTPQPPGWAAGGAVSSGRSGFQQGKNEAGDVHSPDREAAHVTDDCVGSVQSKGRDSARKESPRTGTWA